MNNIDNILNTIRASKKLSKERKEYLIDFIVRTNENEWLTDREKARKIGLAVNAFNAYLSEAELNSLSRILQDTYKVSFGEITQPFKNIFDSLNVITNPWILVSLIILFLVALFYFKVLK